MNDALAFWHEEHAGFAKLLDLLETQLNLFHRGQTPNYALMADIMCYMTQYPDLLHHPREDMAFELVRQRVPSLGPVVDELTIEHEVAVRNSAQLAQDLESVVDGAILPRETVEMPGREYIAHFRHHMSREEAVLFPAVATLLTSRDWQAIDTAIEKPSDPLFGIAAVQQYTALRRQIFGEAGVKKQV